MGFTSGEPFVVDDEHVDAFKRLKRKMYCGFCGKDFKLGERARFCFIPKYSNPWVCADCDNGNNDDLESILIKREKEFRKLKRTIYRVFK